MLRTEGTSASTRQSFLFAIGLRLATLFFFLFAYQASHAAVVSIVGDRDGFGGLVAMGSPPDGTIITCCFDNAGAGDLGFMDVWSFQLEETPTVINYSHSYSNSFANPLQSATLAIQAAGMGNARGPWSVLFNGIDVGDIGGPNSLLGATEVTSYFFDIPLVLLTGNDSVSLIYQDTGSDGFAINYSELSVSSVPLPGAAWLYLGALAYLARRKL